MVTTELQVGKIGLLYLANIAIGYRPLQLENIHANFYIFIKKIMKKLLSIILLLTIHSHFLFADEPSLNSIKLKFKSVEEFKAFNWNDLQKTLDNMGKIDKTFTLSIVVQANQQMSADESVIVKELKLELKNATNKKKIFKMAKKASEKLIEDFESN